MRIFVKFTTKPHYHLLYIFCSIYYKDYSCFLSFTNNPTYKGKQQENLGQANRTRQLLFVAVTLHFAVRVAIVVHVTVRGVIVRVHIAIGISVRVKPRNVAVDVGRTTPHLKQNNPI